MKTVAALCIATLVGSAAAFTPATFSGRTNTRVFSDVAVEEAAPVPVEEAPIEEAPVDVPYDVWANYVGGTDLRGKEFKFDPLKLSEAYPDNVMWFRECELRHVRTAMLAVLGFISTDFMRIPGDMYSFEAIPRTIDAHDALLKTGPMYQIALFIGLWDVLVTAPACKAMGDGEREPGDYGLYAFAPKTKEAFDKKRSSELLNGRLAMCAIGGIATQSVINGHGFPYI